MTRYLLDTNVIGNAIKPVPSQALAGWMLAQTDEDLFISAITLAEIRHGVLERPTGRKRRELEDWFSGRSGPSAFLPGASCRSMKSPPWHGRGQWLKERQEAVRVAPSI